MNEYLERFRHYLEERGMHPTGRRLSIAAHVYGLTGHHSIEDIYRRLKETEPGLGQATVYRTLRVLLEAGLVRELRLGDGTGRYEAVRGARAHGHLICRNCGAIVEISDRRFGRLQRQMAEAYGFSLEEQLQSLFGLCTECRAGSGVKVGVKRETGTEMETGESLPAGPPPDAGPGAACRE